MEYTHSDWILTLLHGLHLASVHYQPSARERQIAQLRQHYLTKDSKRKAVFNEVLD